MKYKFTKMHGAGNDYVYIEDLNDSIKDFENLAIKISDRHFGVGGDGLVVIQSSKVADATMRMFNNDGSEGKMCGNAIRCVAKYLFDRKLAKSEMTIQTLSGIKHIEGQIENGKMISAKVEMGQPEFVAKFVPVLCDKTEFINESVKSFDLNFDMTAVSMGNPHVVTFVDDVDNFAVEKYGRIIENLEIFPDKVNVEFVQIVDKNTIKMRVWERGSGETFACGTGACASVAVCVRLKKCEPKTNVEVKLLGGSLIISQEDIGMVMQGEAKEVFNGEIEI